MAGPGTFSMKIPTDNKTRLLHDAENRDVNDFIATALAITHGNLPSINIDALKLMLTIFRVSESILYDLESSAQRPAGVSSAGFHLLWIIWLCGSVEASAAATMMGASRATISGLSNTLEGSGLIKRRQSTVDGRSRLFSLTDAGKTKFQKIFKDTDTRYVSWYEVLTDAEAKTLTALLSKLASASNMTARQRT